MLDLLKGIFGEKVDLQDLINNGATIVDVRTKDEYKSGHIKNSVNIPLDKLGSSLGKLDKNKPVITCCASGMRSASARSILKANGFNEVHNGGAWASLKKYKL
jgi:phage shock protein E